MIDLRLRTKGTVTEGGSGQLRERRQTTQGYSGFIFDSRAGTHCEKTRIVPGVVHCRAARGGAGMH